MNPAALAVLLILGISRPGAAAPGPAGAASAPAVTAPVAYQDLMLVLVTKDGAAAVIFNKRNANGSEVEYSFRYESTDGNKKHDGIGKLFEAGRGVSEVSADGLFIVAGPVRIEWSRGGAHRGFIYYSPEVVTVHLAHADNFKGVKNFQGEMIEIKKLDLRRFMKK